MNLGSYTELSQFICFIKNHDYMLNFMCIITIQGPIFCELLLKLVQFPALLHPHKVNNLPYKKLPTTN